MKTDTIAAAATPMAGAGIGIIRISGQEAAAVCDKIFCAKNKKTLAESKSHTIHYGYIIDKSTNAVDNSNKSADAVDNSNKIADDREIIDEVLVMLMKAPNSYTREDTVEINCHGGALVMQRVLEAVIKNGARPAEPGEFTKRAFLNGRIDLAQAESVIDIINSKNDFALKSSMHQLQGSVSKKVRNLRERILHETAFIESAIDDPEHYSLDGYRQQLGVRVSVLKQEIQKLIDSADNGSVLKEGIHTVIAGKPNVGKSSILNILAGSERAIVTDIAGTTRDVLEQQINLNGISLNIIDTAGIRDTNDAVEKIGVAKAKEYLAKADLILYVIDSSKRLTEEDREIAGLIQGKNVIILLNKSDLEQEVGAEDIAHISEHIISVSAKEGDGIDELTNKISSMFLHGSLTFNDEVVITNLRHKHALLDALESLKLVEESMQNQMPEDFYSIDLLNAYEALGTIIGESIEDDLADKIFSKFCMGK